VVDERRLSSGSVPSEYRRTSHVDRARARSKRVVEFDDISPILPARYHREPPASASSHRTCHTSSGIQCSRIQVANSDSVLFEAARPSITRTTSGSEASRSWSFNPRNTYVAMNAARLLPSRQP